MYATSFRKEGAVDPEHNFRMQYQLIERNEQHVTPSRARCARLRTLYLATDPDREGEAISWHLYEILQRARRSRRQESAPRCLLRDHAQRHSRGNRCAARVVA